MLRNCNYYNNNAYVCGKNVNGFDQFGESIKFQIASHNLLQIWQILNQIGAEECVFAASFDNR